MKQVKIIIGANFGDEGKGLITDYFADKLENPIVVRFNGGAQAGHTVCRKSMCINTQVQDFRIVFHHFGSGTLAGAPTYLTEDFIVNPILYNEEFKQLTDMDIFPKVYVNPNALVTIPFDMILNQTIEKQRGHMKHGSCGIGIQETVKRSAEFLPLYVKDLNCKGMISNKLYAIRNKWIEKRKEFLGIDQLPEYIWNDGLIEKFIDDCQEFLNYINIEDNEFLLYYQNIIFEGAQGLLLDWDTKYFPHATPSHTGLTNLVKYRDLLKDYEFEVIYMTRAYLTRHGAGPLETECPKMYKNIVDETNIPNEWQDSLRYGYLDFHLLKETIYKDLTNMPNIDRSICVTCLDQVPKGCFVYKVKGEDMYQTVENTFLTHLKNYLDINKIYTSHGPTKDTVNLLT